MKKKKLKKKGRISKTRGKLGVLIPGLGGAVSTTFIAGLEAVKNQAALPIGSLTQMGTIRLGKPMIWSFLDGMCMKTIAMRRP